MKKHLALLPLTLITASLFAQAQTSEQIPGTIKFERASQFPTSPIVIPDHPDDVFWDDQFTIGGPDWSISSMLFDDEDNLYVAVKCFTTGTDFVIPSLKRDYRFPGNDNVSIILARPLLD